MSPIAMLGGLRPKLVGWQVIFTRERKLFGHSIHSRCLALFLVLATALVLRGVNNTPTNASFWLDEAEYSMRSQYILDHDGAYDTDKLFDHPPLFMYLQAFSFKLFGNDWFIARGLGIFLGLLTMALFYQLGKEWLGRETGLLAAAVFAVTPITVMLNRDALIENLLGLNFALILLFTLRYEKGGRPFYLYGLVALIALAFYIKYTSMILVPPYLYYYYQKRLWQNREGQLALGLMVLLVIPAAFMILHYDVLGFHSGKTTKTFHENWDWMPSLLLTVVSHLETLATLILRSGLALIPFYFGVKHHLQKDSLFPKVLCVWVATSVIFFLSMNVTGYHYDYHEFLPMIPLIAAGMYLKKEWVLPVGVSLILISLVLIPWGSDDQTGALNYLEGQMEAGDVIVATPHAEVSYHFKDQEVTVLESSELEQVEPDWVVGTRRHFTNLEANGLNVTAILSNYTLVYESDFDSHIGFLIYHRSVP